MAKLGIALLTNPVRHSEHAGWIYHVIGEKALFPTADEFLNAVTSDKWAGVWNKHAKPVPVSAVEQAYCAWRVCYRPELKGPAGNYKVLQEKRRGSFPVWLIEVFFSPTQKHGQAGNFFEYGYGHTKSLHFNKQVLSAYHVKKAATEYHISRFAIRFLTALSIVVGVCLVSSTTRLLAATTEQELLMLKFEQFNEQLSLKNQEILELESELSRLYNLIANRIAELETLEDWLRKRLPTPKTSVATIASVSSNSSISDQTINNLHSSLAGFKQVANDIPTIWPVNGYITSRYGYRRSPYDTNEDGGSWQFHSGIDIAARAGTPVIASGNGVITFSGWMGVYGLTLKIKHDYDFETVYGHLLNTNLSVGDIVSAKQIIGYVGSSGRSTGSHLHFEIRKDGKTVNPLNYLGGE